MKARYNIGDKGLSWLTILYVRQFADVNCVINWTLFSTKNNFRYLRWENDMKWKYTFVIPKFTITSRGYLAFYF